MVGAYKIILAENASVRRAEDLARRLKKKEKKDTKRIVDFVTSDELDEMGEEIGNKLNAKVKIVQTKVEARLLIKIRGNIEETSKALKKIKKRLVA